MSRLLDVYLNDRFVGQLEQTHTGDLTFTYDINQKAPPIHGLSISMPWQTAPFTGAPVKAFFAGLLPEASVRERLASYLGLSSKNPFALLEAVGGDCAGALALYPHGQVPPLVSDDVEILDEHRLREVLDLIKRRPMLAGDEGYRLSLAGAQDKLAVGFQQGQVLLKKGGQPTTHILKPMIERVQDSAHNEFYCMQLANMVGLDVPETSLHYVDDKPYYLVARYDRELDPQGEITRIHQEDFCQALGIPPEIKYEREGGPSVSNCQALMNQHSARPAVDQMKFLRMLLFNFFIGNADAHGKNFSLLYQGKKPCLAPAYDLMSTAVYPDLASKMAMKIGGRYTPEDVYMRHFFRLIPPTKAAQANLNVQVKTLAEQLLSAAPQLKKKLLQEELQSDVFDDIMVIIKERTQRLLQLS